MAEIAVLDTLQNQGNRMGDGAYVRVAKVVASTAGSTVFAAPGDGKLVKAVMTAGSAHDATNNYATITLVNKSNSDAAMFGTNDTGDGTDTAAYGTRDLVLSTTTANLAVDEGDWLVLTTTVQGTLGSATEIQLFFELD